MPDIDLHHGDCLDVLRELPDASVDACVTDPPYLLGFMGRAWDTRAAHEHLDWHRAWCDEAFRVLKPGGHMLAFGGTRTWHRLACAIEDAGFEVRDSIAWMYGSGFPKSLDVSKAIDKAAGAEREVVGFDEVSWSKKRAEFERGEDSKRRLNEAHDPGRGGYTDAYAASQITAPATDDARTWQGWGTALKPAHEPIVVARKPLAGTVAANVLAHGTGALNVDGCRVGFASESDRQSAQALAELRAKGRRLGVLGEPGQGDTLAVSQSGDTRTGHEPVATNPAGRWPANVVLDESQAEALDQMSGESVSPSKPVKQGGYHGGGFDVGKNEGTPQDGEGVGYGDNGGASRFFFIAREDQQCSDDASGDTDTTGTTDPAASAAPAGASSSAAPVERLTSTRFRYVAKADASERVRVNGTAHPTVKPLALMRWLVRLVTPPGGTVLEPFAGSGTTVEACLLEGFDCIAIEREADYLPLIRQRIARRRDPVEAIRGAGEDGGLFDLLGGGARMNPAKLTRCLWQLARLTITPDLARRWLR